MKVALITGGAGGIGDATARLLLIKGWQVAIADLNVEPVAALTQEYPERVLTLTSDVRAPDAAEVACAAVVEKWGQLDFLVNCAGVNRHSPFEDLSLEDWQFVLDVNLTGTFLFMKAAARHMLAAGSGAIVNLSSIAGARGVPDRAAYAATKAAVISITKSAAVGWATRGVRVNAIAPGFVDTPLVRKYTDSGALDINQLLNTTPMRRLASPQEIASAIAFLGGDDSGFVTGQTLFVDGGFTAEYGIPSTYK